jgi:hypothetical protein
MPTRERRLSAVMSSTPSWREKRLLTQDDNLHPFCWTYGTGELIEELARIDEILNLTEVLQQPTDIPNHFGIDICFEESFIDSHEMLVELLDRVTVYWNSNGQQDVVNLHKIKSVDNLTGLDTDKQKTYWTDLMLASYKNANSVYKHMRDSLLRMRFLYEQLKPETQALVKCCSYKVQLQNSMLAQKIVHEASHAKPFTFKPACGFKLDRTETVHATLQDRIADVEMKMSRLQLQKDILLNQLNDDEVVRDALEVCDVLRNILAEGSRIQDHREALKYATEIIAPKKNILQRYSSSFENTLHAFPDSYPSTCTQEEASEFFMSMLEALDKDTKHLVMLKNMI